MSFITRAASIKECTEAENRGTSKYAQLAVLLLAINVNSAHNTHTHGKHEATLNLDSRTYAASCQCSHRPSHV